MDGYADAYDTALLVTGDTDQVPTICAVKRLFPDKKVLVAFPPNRVNDQLEREAHAVFRISQSSLRRSLFPDVVLRHDGFELHNPWPLPSTA